MTSTPAGGAPAIAPHGTVIGVDLGSRRIGVAVSDRDQRLALSLTTVTRGGDPAADRRALATLVAEREAVGVVVGLPRSLSGRLGPAARTALEEVAALRASLGVPVDTEDERLTTVVASAAMRAAGGGRRAGRTGVGPARGQVDAVAAAVLLQSWLDRRAGRGET